MTPKQQEPVYTIWGDREDLEEIVYEIEDMERFFELLMQNATDGLWQSDRQQRGVG